MIHGGPHGSFGSSWSPRTHIFSGAGYGVIYLNPRGSTGYGQEFTRGCVQDWGGGDYKDLMAGVDAAIAAHPWIDAERLGVFGGSYGCGVHLPAVHTHTVHTATTTT
jgi:dipeptidyl aminopeptidase/acylaminoacyl peptidase